MFFKIYSYTSKEFLFKILKKQPIEAVVKLEEITKNFLEYYSLHRHSDYMDFIENPDLLNLIQEFQHNKT